MDSPLRAVLRLLLFILLAQFGVGGWPRLAVLQQLLLQCQASYLWQSAFKKFQQEEDSVEEFYRILWLDPLNSEAKCYTAISSFHQATNFEQTAPTVDTMGLDQTDAVIYNNRAIIRSNRGDWQGAIADYTESIQLQPDSAAAHLNRGIAYRELGDRIRALADLQQAVQLWPEEMADWHQAVLEELNTLDAE